MLAGATTGTLLILLLIADSLWPNRFGDRYLDWAWPIAALMVFAYALSGILGYWVTRQQEAAPPRASGTRFPRARLTITHSTRTTCTAPTSGAEVTKADRYSANPSSTEPRIQLRRAVPLSADHRTRRRQIIEHTVGRSSANASADCRSTRYDHGMREGLGYLPRRAAELIEEALSDTRVVIVNGARQTGKSTLAERCLRDRPETVKRYLDDPRTRASAATDPVAFLDTPGTMLIDEVQRVPDLWLAIKNTVDRDPRPGRFLLTGSARLLGLSTLPDALPGRSETIELFPLSQGEITGTPDGLIDAAFTRGHKIRTELSELRRRDYLALAFHGGYPEAVRRDNPRRRAQFFKSYLDDIISRDVHQVADIQRSSDMRRLITALAAQSGGLLNYSRLSSDLGIPLTTVRDYVGLLEVIYLIRLVPAWSANATTRAISTPKLVFTDSGLAAHLLAGITNDITTGGLIETFVLGELTRQLSWSRTMAHLHHYRDRDGYEVDAILEDSAGRIIGIEIKASETVRTDDFRALRILQRRLGDRFHAGLVLYCGDQQLPFGDRQYCLPISALWTTPPA